MSSSDNLCALPFVFVDYAISPQDALAKDIIALDKANPADLSAYVIWCESRAQIHAIQLSLMHAAKAVGIEHLLLPMVTTLQDWVSKQHTTTRPTISETNKQLLLVEAIRQNPSIFQTNNAWPLAKELVKLFNECTLAQISLQNGEAALRAVLQESYRYPNPDLSNISRESEIVYRLWQAYREQIEARELIDPIDDYCQWLINKHEHHELQHYFIVGKHRLHSAEVIFLQQLCERHNVSIYTCKLSHTTHAAYQHPHVRFIQNTQYENQPTNLRELALDIVYDRSSHTYDRIQNLKHAIKENIFQDWLSLYTCKSIENHVSAVSLQAKTWLIEGIPSIGIIVNDRLLARRIRAVLEDQGIQPTDLGGWTLSTTSAATSIEVLLDCIENNFKKDNLLDLLSSPFLPQNSLKNNSIKTQGDSSYKQQVFELKKFFKKHHNTPTDNLDTLYELATQHFTKQNIEHADIDNVFNRLNTTYKAFNKFKNSGEYEIHQLSECLISTLQFLGIYSELGNDIAGVQLINTLETQIQSTRNNTIKITWKEWRQWLRDIFESHYFIPENTDNRITLCSFEHVDNLQFNATIIAGVEENRLTNTKNKRTFFNDKVCHELHLPTHHETNAINFVRYRQLLQQSEQVLLSAEIESHGEAQEICSWVKLVNLFSQECYASSLYDSQLDALIQAYNEYKQNKHALIGNKTTQPSVSAPAELIPTRVSATQYQSLLDCPYQYFAKYVLALREQETADEFEASDFGTLVHQCLYEFHFNDNNKSDLVFTSEHHDSLSNHLTDLSTSIFMRAAFPKSVKQAWLQRWLTNIPAYIDWAIERANEWRTLRGESIVQTHFNSIFTIYGQIDRIDSNNKNIAVVDYKTGTTKPSKQDVLSGELVQLPFYALLDDNITQAEYLSLGTQGEVKASALINEEELIELRKEHKNRLEVLLHSLLNNATLTAQGVESTCRVCNYQGLCRKQHWNDSTIT